jgi:hypothetical protein
MNRVSVGSKFILSAHRQIITRIFFRMMKESKLQIQCDESIHKRVAHQRVIKYAIIFKFKENLF